MLRATRLSTIACSLLALSVLVAGCAHRSPAASAPVAGRPLPPPPPAFPHLAAADCTPGPFIVFFAWDSTEITPEAASILDNAIARYVDCGRVRVTIAGFTDRSGPAPYNLALSARRADAVKAYFGAHGVDAAMMAIRPFGEDPAYLRVPTADNVQQVQNRRVVITYGLGD